MKLEILPLTGTPSTTLCCTKQSKKVQGMHTPPAPAAFSPQAACARHLPQLRGRALRRQGAAPQGTAVNHSQPSRTSPMLLQDLKLEAARNDWCLDGTCPRLQFCTGGSLA